MDSVLVSVIIPFYNTEKTLFDRCIKSVINQEYKTIECIVVDDGSDDEHSKFLDDYSKLDDRITIFHKENGGLGNTRNYGVNESSGEYVFFLDSDDYISPYAIKNGVDLAIANKADVVIGGLVHINTDEAYVFSPSERRTIKINDQHGFKELVSHICGYRNSRFILENCSVGPSACSKLVKREILNVVSFVNDKFWDEDNLWCISLFSVCRCVLIADVNWYCYVINPQSMIRRYSGDRSLEFQTRAKQEFGLVMEKWPGCAQAAYHSVFHGMLNYLRTDVANPYNPKKKKERYSDFVNAIGFKEFEDSIMNISFEYENRYIHKTIKKLIIHFLRKNNTKIAFDLLSECIRKLRF